MELRCLLSSDVSGFFWLIDGNSSFFIGQTGLAEQGIRYDNTLSRDRDQKYTALFIEPRAENNNTVVQCIAYLNSPPYVQESGEVMLRVQGEKVTHFTV